MRIQTTKSLFLLFVCFFAFKYSLFACVFSFFFVELGRCSSIDLHMRARICEFHCLRISIYLILVARCRLFSHSAYGPFLYKNIYTILLHFFHSPFHSLCSRFVARFILHAAAWLLFFFVIKIEFDI